MTLDYPDLRYIACCDKCHYKKDYYPFIRDYATLEEARDSVEKQMSNDGWLFVENDDTHICSECVGKAWMDMESE